MFETYFVSLGVAVRPIYQRDGETATLASRIPGEKLADTGLRYRLTMKKK